MVSEPKQRSTVVSKLLSGERKNGADGEVDESSRDARAAIPAPMLDLVMRNGRIESFSYVYLSRVSFDPKGRLLLYFGDDVAVLEGRNMGDIRQKVRMHKASEIFEGIEAEEALKQEHAAHVERIYLTSAQEEENNESGRGSKTDRQ